MLVEIRVEEYHSSSPQPPLSFHFFQLSNALIHVQQVPMCMYHEISRSITTHLTYHILKMLPVVLLLQMVCLNAIKEGSVKDRFIEITW